MNKEEFKKIDREQMIIAFNQLKDDYSNLFNELEQEKNKINTIKKLMSIGDITDEALFTLVQTTMAELERLEGIEEKLDNRIKMIKDLKEMNKELEIELDKTADLLNTCNKRLESISRELGLTNEDTCGYVYEEILEEIKQIKEDECTATKCQIITQNYIRKDKIKELINQLEYDEQKTRNIKYTRGTNHTQYLSEYDKIRLKAYITKTKEIKNRLKELLEEK